ncbi:ArnT family glycosyltransferase [Cryptosporangium japonicum]|uniref:4-amino-4-deoxy-L-arabinose transferase-like glycosyltransferase n=1 Tax=Cryptosporangium japonicum TaxID=80872 RepID=A0ABN0V8E5_9ACTN
MTATLSRPEVLSPVRPPGRSFPGRRLSVLALLLGTAVLYLWNLSASGYANEFYAAAVQAGTQSWKALLFGSLDSANYITVDKPPASLWVMGLSGRLFGFNSWSMLVPQALMGVAAVGLLYAAVKRWFGHAAGLLAGAALALTPVAVLMFRFNNPDALLTLLLVAGGYFMVRAVESGRTGWLLLAGSALGFGFLTKMLQAFLVLPAFALVYLVAGTPRWRRRIGQLLLAGVAMVVSAGWWIALVELWPASSRPYIGGSEGNSALELALGYNGLSRLTGGEGNNGNGFSGTAGLFRLFNSQMGGQLSWLLPAALIALVVGVIWTARRPRTDRTRAGLILWGGWMLVTGLVLSFMEGTVHEYYTVAMAPGVVATIVITGRLLWHERRSVVARVLLAAMVAATGVWSYVLLNRTADWYSPLRYVVVTGALVAAVALVFVGRWRKVATVALVVGVLTGLAGSGAYAVQTAGTAHSGSTPTAGPVSTATTGGPGGGRGGTPPSGAMPSGSSPGSSSSGSSSSGSSSSGGSSAGSSSSGASSAGGSSAAGSSAGGVPAAGNRPGGGGGATTSAELTALLTKSDATWAAAVGTSQSAASLELTTGKAVMSIGGWSGSDESTTLARFQALVKAGRIGYFIAGGQGGGGSDSVLSRITTWVEANYTATTVGGTTVYDLTS